MPPAAKLSLDLLLGEPSLYLPCPLSPFTAPIPRQKAPHSFLRTPQLCTDPCPGTADLRGTHMQPRQHQTHASHVAGEL